MSNRSKHKKGILASFSLNRSFFISTFSLADKNSTHTDPIAFYFNIDWTANCVRYFNFRISHFSIRRKYFLVFKNRNIATVLEFSSVFTQKLGQSAAKRRTNCLLFLAIASLPCQSFLQSLICFRVCILNCVLVTYMYVTIQNCGRLLTRILFWRCVCTGYTVYKQKNVKNYKQAEGSLMRTLIRVERI